MFTQKRHDAPFAFSFEAASDGNPNHLQVCTTPKRECIAIYRRLKMFLYDHLTTYYLVAFLFPISFRGFWLNAK